MDVPPHILRTTLVAAITMAALNTHAQAPPQLVPEPQNILLHAIGGQPHGTHIARLRHMDWSYHVTSPIAFKNTYLTGFSYTERGGALTQLLAIVTLIGFFPVSGPDVTFELTPDIIAPFGLSIEYLSANHDTDAPNPDADNPYQLTLRLDHALYLTGNLQNRDKLPITLTWGVEFQLWSLPHTDPNFVSGGEAALRIPFEFAFPLTRWAQIDASITLSSRFIPVEIASGATLHLGNRFFLAAGSSYTINTFGPFLRAGVRL